MPAVMAREWHGGGVRIARLEVAHTPVVIMPSGFHDELAAADQPLRYVRSVVDTLHTALRPGGTFVSTLLHRSFFMQPRLMTAVLGSGTATSRAIWPRSAWIHSCGGHWHTRTACRRQRPGHLAYGGSYLVILWP